MFQRAPQGSHRVRGVAASVPPSCQAEMQQGSVRGFGGFIAEQGSEDRRRACRIPSVAQCQGKFDGIGLLMGGRLASVPEMRDPGDTVAGAGGALGADEGGEVDRAALPEEPPSKKKGTPEEGEAAYRELLEVTDFQSEAARCSAGWSVQHGIAPTLEHLCFVGHFNHEQSRVTH